MDASAAHRPEKGAALWGLSWQKMMMWWFIVTEGLLFAGFLAAYGFARLANPDWPVPSTVFDLRFVTAMTFVLITSSATMATAVAAARNGDVPTAKRFLLGTLAGGTVFLGMQAWEWTHFIGQGARLDSNPWGPAQFSQYFFLVTGLHGTHVLIGAVVLLFVTLKAVRGRVSAEGVELAGLYWHFVDLVWVFVFGCFYLL